MCPKVVSSIWTVTSMLLIDVEESSMKMVCVGDKFEILVTDSLHWKNQRHKEATFSTRLGDSDVGDIWIQDSGTCHQHKLSANCLHH